MPLCHFSLPSHECSTASLHRMSLTPQLPPLSPRRSTRTEQRRVKHLKQLNDAVKFREQLGYAFEQASLPGLTDEQRIQQLTFVVIGAGPTGVELCGELRDFVAQVRGCTTVSPFPRLFLLVCLRMLTTTSFLRTHIPPARLLRRRTCRGSTRASRPTSASCS